MTDVITGPGVYRRRDGGLATVTGAGNRHWETVLHGAKGNGQDWLLFYCSDGRCNIGHPGCPSQGMILTHRVDQAVALLPGDCVRTDAIRDVRHYRQIADAFRRAGARKGEADQTQYLHHPLDLPYVGWSRETDGVFFSSDRPEPFDRVLTPEQVLGTTPEAVDPVSPDERFYIARSRIEPGDVVRVESDGVHVSRYDGRVRVYPDEEDNHE